MSHKTFDATPETMPSPGGTGLSNPPWDRVAQELDKALLGLDRPSVFFEMLREAGQLSAWFPEIGNLVGIQQDPEHHPEGDAYTHTMMVIDAAAGFKENASDPRMFMVAALCHDFGKAVTTEYDNAGQKWVSHGHGDAGVPIAVNFVRRIYGEKEMEDYVADMVGNHMTPFHLYRSKAGQDQWMELYGRTACPEDLILLCKADSDGRTCKKPFQEKEEYLRGKLSEYREFAGKKSQALAIAGIPAGARNTITKDQAVAMAAEGAAVKFTENRHVIS